MIVRMKKISVIVQAKDTSLTLIALRKAGVLHVEHQKHAKSENIEELTQNFKSLSRAIDVLGESKENVQIIENRKELIRRILHLVEQKEVLKEGIRKIEKDIERWKEWGSFDPELVYDLENKGIWARLLIVPKKKVKEVPREIILEEIFRKGGMLYCVAISDKEIKLPFQTLQMPEAGLEEMHLNLAREKKKLEDIEGLLTDLSKYKNDLLGYKRELASLIEFNRVHLGMGREGDLTYVRGYCPEYNTSLLERIAKNEQWGLLIEEPDENDNVPTLIKNPRWVEIIKPVFQMIKTIPGYKEVDTSLWFLVFFSVFFGMLVGDAGYGLVFFIINLFCHIKFRDRVKDRKIFFLTYVLSFCAIGWGVLTGTFFGQAYLPQRIQPLLPFLRENANVQALCFLIGAAHLSIAHTWKFIRKMPSLKAFSEVGWIGMLWAAYFLAKYLILGASFPGFGKWLLIGGASLIILCTNPRKNILKGIGSGIGDFLLHVVNSFTDVVSYIRLFAVGAATVAVADAFNQMASGIGYSNIFFGFLAALVLLFGHTLNILLGAMAILVHGVRLNVLEFSSHLDMEWSGVEYSPFKEEKFQITNSRGGV